MAGSDPTECGNAHRPDSPPYFRSTVLDSMPPAERREFARLLRRLLTLIVLGTATAAAAAVMSVAPVENTHIAGAD